MTVDEMKKSHDKMLRALDKIWDIVGPEMEYYGEDWIKRSTLWKHTLPRNEWLIYNVAAIVDNVWDSVRVPKKRGKK